MSQPGARTDAELVHAYTSGNRAALGDLYDRFAPGLYDTAAAMLRDRDAASDVVQEVFCVAAAKLDQLRDATRIKPWLYSIARHEIYRRTERRSRTTSFSAMGLDGFGDEGGMDPMAPPDPHAEGAGAVSTELASLVRDAAYGLDPSDQLLLELSARQGLVGAELAAAIGVPVAKAHSMLFRMRERLERAVGAVVVTRGGRKRCEELAAVLVGWDGRFDVLWRKRISRHIDDCETCQATRRGAAVLSMAGFAPAFALPAMLRERTLSKALGAGSGGSGDGRPDSAVSDRYRFDGDGFPMTAGRRNRAGGRGGGDGLTSRSLPIALAGTMVAGLAIVLAMFTLAPPTIDGSISDDDVSPAGIAPESSAVTAEPPTTPASTTTTTSTTTTSTTTTSTTTTVPPPPPPTQVATPVVTPSPPTVAVVTSSPTVFALPPPAASTTTTVAPAPPTTTSTTTTAPSPSGSPPQIRSFAVSPSTLSSCGDLSPDAAASVYDSDGDVVSVTVAWSGRMGSGSSTLSGSGLQYTGPIGPFPATAGYTYAATVTATDATGLKATASTSVGVGPC